MGPIQNINRLRFAIACAMGQSVSTDVLDRVYDAIVGLARVETSEHDKALEVLKWQLEVAWRTMKREAPIAAQGRVSLAGAILALVSEQQRLINSFNERGNELTRQDQEIEGLRNDVRQAEAEVDRLKKLLDKHQRPGFQVILDAIRKRSRAADEQADPETREKLEVLAQAFDAMMVPAPGKPKVSVAFSWPRRTGDTLEEMIPF